MGTHTQGCIPTQERGNEYNHNLITMRKLKQLKWVMLIAIITIAQQSPAVAVNESVPLMQAQALLKSKSFSDKSRAIDELANDGGSQARKILAALLESRLYHIKKDKRLVIANKQGREFQLTDALSEEALGTVSKRKIKRISLNNRLRSRIRSALAVIDLRSPDADRRLTAVKQMLDRPAAQHAV
ncbi:MAG: hypothetical protein GY938_07465, partial [Ketobacter sp.]|nr:hypothetical protein [Ketobacter sp.]